MGSRIDGWLFLGIVGVVGASLANLYAVGGVVGEGLFLRQAIFGCIGFIVLWLCSLVDATTWQRAGAVLYGLGLLALVAVLVLGVVRSGTRGWFVLGPLTLQPSEFARVGAMLLVATYIGRREESRLKPMALLGLGVIISVPVALILLQPDLGVALTYVPVLIAGLWLAGLPTRVWVALFLLATVAVGVAWTTALKPYQRDRVLTVFDPDRDPYGAGYQVRQSHIAVGSGGFSGQGLGQGSQSVLRFLPAQHTDFAFATWAEATGFLGTSWLLIAFALILWRLWIIAMTSGDRFGLVVAMVVASWLAFQVVVNLGMVLGLLPTTGVPLPLFSYGGSSLLSTCVTLGIVQAVWRSRLVNR